VRIRPDPDPQHSLKALINADNTVIHLSSPVPLSLAYLCISASIQLILLDLVVTLAVNG
jgi:hypothetical protein